MNKTGNDELQDVFEQTGSLSEEREARYQRRRYVRPAVDIYATEKEMVVLADMPGVKKGGVQVMLERDDLIIEGKAAGREEEESALPWGYYRRFKLRTAFERERIRASLRGGVLRVNLPKAPSERAQKVVVE